MLTLRTMTQAEYDGWMRHSITEYADELVQEEGQTPAQAEEMANKEFHAYLPAGLYTEGQLLLALVADQAVVGYAWVEVTSPDAFLTDFLILEGCRRRGYGFAALEAMFALLIEKGSTSLSLHATSGNAPAVALYKKAGFTIVSQDGCHLNMRRLF